jgi:peptidoglycan/xylan/chitin deacetylase (PgdA/CDA1 family)
MKPRRSVRTRVRDSALFGIRLAGGFSAAARSRWRAKHLLILCYHGFALEDEHVWDPALFVTRDHLESRLAFLAARRYAVLSLAEGLARLKAGTLPPRAVAITVDDGTYDFHAVAYPVFKRHGVPVTLYVSTYHVFDQRPVFDVAFRYLFWKAWSSGMVELRDPLTKDEGPLRTALERDRAATRVQEAVWRERWSAEKKHHWLGEFARGAGLDWDAFLRSRVLALMRPDEIGALDPGIVDVQLHTHRHRVPEQRELFIREIADNRRALGECGLDPTRLVHFCYPSGVHPPSTLPWLAELGVTSAVTTEPGLSSADQHPLLLPRFVDAGTTSEVEFEGWTSGLRHFIGRAGLGRAQ